MKLAAKAEALRLRRANPNLPGNAIARAVGVSFTTVSRWLRDAGLSVTRYNGSEVLEKLFNENPGQPRKVLAHKAKISESMVAKWMRKHHPELVRVKKIGGHPACAKVLKLYDQKPDRTFTEIAEKAGCSIYSVTIWLRHFRKEPPRLGGRHWKMYREAAKA